MMKYSSQKTKQILIRSLSLIINCLAITYAIGQQVHSHNDYEQSVPFWNAFSAGATSIEVDVFLKNGILYATHEESEIKPDRTIENLYLQPIQRTLSLSIGNQKKLQLLIDIKSEAESTLQKIINVLKKYPTITENPSISIVISGNRPPAHSYTNYPSFIKFDYQSLNEIHNQKIWDKIALISLNFKKITSWNGIGRLTQEDQNKVDSIIKRAHSYGKPFRFWGTPDNKTAWRTLGELGVNYINTDLPFACFEYTSTIRARTYKNTIFSEVYSPLYTTDQKKQVVKNVILLIGDGNGLSHISAATLANGGSLTLTQLKSIGFLKTGSADDFTTDSAAAGTALATGQKTYNRAIGLDTLRKPLINLPELLFQHGLVSGCITTDRMTGATPASFYAHQKDRSLTSQIAADLPSSKLSLFIGGGRSDFNDQVNLSSYKMVDNIHDISPKLGEKIGYFISNADVDGVLQGRGNLLAEATKKGIEFLSANNTPFFLVVEGAKIDKYAHKNEVSGIISEAIDFDRAITEAVKYADASGNTLVLITADHETSGFSIAQGNLKNSVIEGDFTTYDHTAAMVPIFAYGPMSQEFQGIYENSEVFHKILKILGIQTTNDH